MISKWDWTDLVDKIFDTKEWKTVPDVQKKKHCFMVMRILAIKFPVQACQFSVSGMNEVHVLDFFHSYLVKTHRQKPSWTYSKSISKKNKKLEELKLDKESVEMWANRYQMSTKDLNFLLVHFPNEIKTEVKAYEKALKVGT